MGEKHEEFYIDDTALKQIIIDVFYDKVEKKEPVMESAGFEEETCR